MVDAIPSLSMKIMRVPHPHRSIHFLCRGPHHSREKVISIVLKTFVQQVPGHLRQR